MQHTSPHSGDRTGRWWRNTIIYRVDLRSFCDSDGDGVGDLNGLRRRLGYLDLLGVGGMWLTGVLASPIGKGRGHEVDPAVGTLESLELLVGEAHEHDLRVVVDIPVSSRGITERAARDAIARTVEGWIGVGVDGLRLAASPGITRPADEATHDVLQLLRPVVDAHSRCLIGAYVDRWSTARGNLQELDVGVDDRFCTVEFDADRVRSVITAVLTEAGAAHATPAWSIANWLQPRPASRLGGGSAGLARSRAMALVQCALPGVAGINYGDELGLQEPNVTEPTTSVHPGGTPFRGLMPWEGTEPPFGFSTRAESWWPYNPDWSGSTVEAELEDPASTLSLYRQLLQIRHERNVHRGSQVHWYGAPRGCLAFRRDAGGLTCALNTSAHSVPLPPGDLLLTSGPLEDGQLPPNTSAWLA